MDDIAISVDHVSKTFRLPHDKVSSIKSALINFRRKRTYEKHLALNDVSFDIKRGEFFGIVGRNGSGKSTLLKMLAGIYSPSKGTITVNGKLTPFIELGVGFNPELTGRENVFLNGALLGFNRAEMSAMYEEIVEFAELERFMDQKLKNYSSGMQVRLAFSIAIRAKSDILLIDEVLAVGDAAFQQKCYTYFEELKLENRTVVFVSHDMGVVRRFCSRAVYIKDGDMLDIGSPLEIAERYTIDNLEHAQEQAAKTRGDDDNPNKISSKLVKQTDKSATFEVSYESDLDEDLYVGISLLRDEASIAEITTDQDKPLRGKGKVTYTLDTSMFNNGNYQFDAALFRKQNKALLCFTVKKARLELKRAQDPRGGALHLKDTWEYN